MKSQKLVLVVRKLYKYFYSTSPHSGTKNSYINFLTILDPNEEWTSCGNPCSNSCDGTRICPAVCVEGCFCKQDYKKNSNGICVHKNKCIVPTPKPCSGKTCDILKIVKQNYSPLFFMI